MLHYDKITFKNKHEIEYYFNTLLKNCYNPNEINEIINNKNKILKYQRENRVVYYYGNKNIMNGYDNLRDPWFSQPYLSARDQREYERQRSLHQTLMNSNIGIDPYKQEEKQEEKINKKLLLL